VLLVRFFLVYEQQGPAWKIERPMREQDGWDAHAKFVNALREDGFLLLGGPHGSGHPHRALLVVQSDSEDRVRVRLSDDPWLRAGELRIDRIEPWEVLVSHDRLDPALDELARLKP
jgi:uncharacterized protein YciI